MQDLDSIICIVCLVGGASYKIKGIHADICTVQLSITNWVVSSMYRLPGYQLVFLKIDTRWCIVTVQYSFNAKQTILLDNQKKISSTGYQTNVFELILSCLDGTI